MISVIMDNSAIMLKLITSLVLTDDSEAQSKHSECRNTEADCRCQKAALINILVMHTVVVVTGLTEYSGASDAKKRNGPMILPTV